MLEQLGILGLVSQFRISSFAGTSSTQMNQTSYYKLAFRTNVREIFPPERKEIHPTQTVARFLLNVDALRGSFNACEIFQIELE